MRMTEAADNQTGDDAERESTERITDEMLKTLLDKHHTIENVAEQARLIATFYINIRQDVGMVENTLGEMHDAALEITREWMHYTMGGE